MDEPANSEPQRAPSARTYHRRTVLAYVRAYDRGLELPLDDLHGELDDARRAIVKSTRPTALPTARATLAGLEHAQIERMQGPKAVPKTFVV